MIFAEQASIEEKLRILSDAAKYDVACTSSGVQRKAVKGAIGNTEACGICHTFSGDGRCISLLKILFPWMALLFLQTSALTQIHLMPLPLTFPMPLLKQLILLSL